MESIRKLKEIFKKWRSKPLRCRLGFHKWKDGEEFIIWKDIKCELCGKTGVDCCIE